MLVIHAQVNIYFKSHRRVYTAPTISVLNSEWPILRSINNLKLTKVIFYFFKQRFVKEKYFCNFWVMVEKLATLPLESKMHRIFPTLEGLITEFDCS